MFLEPDTSFSRDTRTYSIRNVCSRLGMSEDQVRKMVGNDQASTIAHPQFVLLMNQGRRNRRVDVAMLK